jgi:CO/xanthine dehydrogenase FAD-binding subunit
MFAAEFDYHKASSVAEAIQLLDAHPDSKLLAGGHSLIPLMKLRLARPPAVIDIGSVASLKGITVNNGSIRIGALTTHGEIASSRDIRHGNPLVAEAAGGIGDPQVRNRGTIGGNIAHADPASDWGTVLTALDAIIEVQGPNGMRTIAVGDFFQSAFTTSLAPNEVVTGIQVPVLSRHIHDGGHGHEHESEHGHGHEHEDEHGHGHEHESEHGHEHESEHGHGHDHGHDHGPDLSQIHGEVGEYAKMSHPASFYPVIGGAVVITVEDSRCTAAKIAVGGLVPSPKRAPSVEQALVGRELTMANISAAVDLLTDDLGSDIIGDVFASADFRSLIAPVEVKHALYHAIGLAHH